MDNKELFSDEQLDFLREMSSIGAGNAAGALSQLLECDVDLKVIKIHVFLPTEVPPALAGDFRSYVSAGMKLVGDIDDYLLFLVPEEQVRLLVTLIEGTVPSYKKEAAEPEFAVIEEIGNIVAGTFLRTIYNFCKLSIYHTVPALENGTIFFLIDKVLKRMNVRGADSVLIESEFSVFGKTIKAFLTLTLKKESAAKLAGAIDEARKNMRMK
ncbi:MAG TPA: chemotaxis protein CheC [Candidatus Wunengus sp. YC60]|uniref:chemotaxis protein CheC n=1 Tax=Candidatus Wunengus sp. YC60 TaxID=3367697 RepID=UPI004025E1C8